MKDYYYEFKYVCDGVEHTTKFNACVTFSQLKKNLRGFLAAAGWTNELLYEELKEDEDE